jgi:hypothetical protein
MDYGLSNPIPMHCCCRRSWLGHWRQPKSTGLQETKRSWPGLRSARYPLGVRNTLETGDRDLVIRREIVFLLRNRDRSGSWRSTQATVRAMNALLDASAVVGSLGGSGTRLEVRVNGRFAKTVALPTILTRSIDHSRYFGVLDCRRQSNRSQSVSRRPERATALYFHLLATMADDAATPIE